MGFSNCGCKELNYQMESVLQILSCLAIAIHTARFSGYSCRDWLYFQYTTVLSIKAALGTRKDNNGGGKTTDPISVDRF